MLYCIWKWLPWRNTITERMRDRTGAHVPYLQWSLELQARPPTVVHADLHTQQPDSTHTQTCSTGRTCWVCKYITCTYGVVRACVSVCVCAAHVWSNIPCEEEGEEGGHRPTNSGVPIFQSFEKSGPGRNMIVCNHIGMAVIYVPCLMIIAGWTLQGAPSTSPYAGIPPLFFCLKQTQ